MRRFSLDTWIALGLIVLLIGIAILTALAQDDENAPPRLASFSNHPEGARALRLWLEALGFGIQPDPDLVFQIPENTRLVYLLEPDPGITETEWQLMDEWVENGGTLILGGDTTGAYFAFSHYQFSLRYTDEQEVMLANTPFFSEPRLVGPVAVKTQAYFTTERSDYGVLLATAHGPVLLSLHQGEGQVILSASPYIFSNAGLKDRGVPYVHLNLLHQVDAIGGDGPQGLVWFNEWHHGLRGQTSEPVAGPSEWLRYTPQGRAVLFSVLVLFAALILSGQAFGRPLRLASEISRRSPLEHVTALANLSRRAGHRVPVLRHYHAALKRRMARRYRIDPTLPDEEYVLQLAELKPDLDAAALHQLLSRLQVSQGSENELVQLAQEASDWLQAAER
jgi:hypothetical protein